MEQYGEQIPDTVAVSRTTLYLNGIGLRTYSVLKIPVYAASLYLEHLSDNSDDIIRSPGIKLLAIRFRRGVSADMARDAWRKSLQISCIAPCNLDPEDVERFIAQVPAMHAGDTYHLLFRQNAATVSLNGQQIGTIFKRQFADAILAVFLDIHTELPGLRQGLLGGH